MTFIGIAIFTIYTSQMVTTFGCDPTYSLNFTCDDTVMSKREEVGSLQPTYIGEFPSLAECLAGVEAAKYSGKLEENQRVDNLNEMFCVPKESKK